MVGATAGGEKAAAALQVIVLVSCAPVERWDSGQHLQAAMPASHTLPKVHAQHSASTASVVAYRFVPRPGGNRAGISSKRDWFRHTRPTASGISSLYRSSGMRTKWQSSCIVGSIIQNALRQKEGAQGDQIHEIYHISTPSIRRGPRCCKR
jgi:hypothetical protein